MSVDEEKGRGQGVRGAWSGVGYSHAIAFSRVTVESDWLDSCGTATCAAGGRTVRFCWNSVWIIEKQKRHERRTR